MKNKSWISGLLIVILTSIAIGLRIYYVDYLMSDVDISEDIYNAAKVTVGTTKFSSFFINGLNINDVTNLSIKELKDFILNLELDEENKKIASIITTEILSRLNFLNSVGLEYLTLSRRAGTLSGGEAQRIRLATQIGSRLTGVLYVLDEPSIGLHQRDNGRLIKSLKEMRDLGNTLIVVEHDEDTMRR